MYSVMWIWIHWIHWIPIMGDCMDPDLNEDFLTYIWIRVTSHMDPHH